MIGVNVTLALVCTLAFAALNVNAGHLQEIRVFTSNCDGCGMVGFFGQLSVKVGVIDTFQILCCYVIFL